MFLSQVKPTIGCLPTSPFRVSRRAWGRCWRPARPGGGGGGMSAWGRCWRPARHDTRLSGGGGGEGGRRWRRDLCVSACVCVRAEVRALVCTCGRACAGAHVRARMCGRACACEWTTGETDTQNSRSYSVPYLQYALLADVCIVALPPRRGVVRGRHRRARSAHRVHRSLRFRA